MTVTVTGYTAAHMQAIVDATVASGHVTSGHLILVLHDGSTIDAGAVVGPTGPAGSGYIICTSTTRPTTPSAGMAIYETDSKLVRTWNGSHWRLQERVICTNTTRPTAFLDSSDEGLLIYETDTNTEYIWDGAAFRLYQRPVIVCTSSTRPGSPLVGARIYETDTGKNLKYYSVSTGWAPEDWAASWGLIGYSESTTSHPSVTAEQNIAGMSVTWNAVAHRNYKTTMVMPRCQQGGGVAEVQAFLCDGSNAHIEPVSWSLAVGIDQVFAINTEKVEGSISAGSVTRKMRALCSSSNCDFKGSAFPGHVLVEDIGPSGAPN